MRSFGLFLLALALPAAHADEGMWQPHQLPKISAQLQAAGLEIDPTSMQRLDQFPMNAIISLGGCTASFVSPQGLIVTNHHCIYGSIAYNSTPEQNLLRDGFVAADKSKEIPASPGTRVYVTEEVTEVTDTVLDVAGDAQQGDAYYQAIEQNKKRLVGACETSQDYRCEVYTFHGGASYFLIRYLAIRDVRLVYAPPSSIGKFGGDTDNWMWPRHTGDWGFYRAYVGADGLPADYNTTNRPYTPAAHFAVNKDGLAEDDFVMVLGYPGRTNRYRTALEVQNQFEWTYPTAKQYREDYIEAIKSAAAAGSDARLKYENTIAGLANYAKNYGSMITSYRKGSLLQDKQILERNVLAWIDSDESRKQRFGMAYDNLEHLLVEEQSNQERDLLLAYMGRTTMWSVATRLLKLAHERQKPDLERDSGYQERDMARFAQGLQSVDRRYDADVDVAVLMHFFSLYQRLPDAERVDELDAFFGLDDPQEPGALQAKLESMHARTGLDEANVRLQWMEASLAEFEASNDPYIQFARALWSYNDRIEQKSKALAGELLKARPLWMEAILAYKQSLGEPVYADANSSLRITYGSVTGYSPQDGLVAVPFTTAEGMLAKYIPGDEEFDLPEPLRRAIAARDYQEYLDPALDSIAINYLTTVDITGGNSGSPTLNSRAEFVGLAFDSVYESVIGDWSYDPSMNRTIHVSSPYMLWTMKYIDGAGHLLDEMTLVRSRN